MSKEIAIKFENQLSKYYLQTIQDLLEEQEINPHQFLHMAVNQIKRNPRLLGVFQKSPASVFSSILTCAELGLSPASQMGEAWLIPYGSECQFQIGYQGLAKILYKNPDVQNITSECVYENDEFNYELGLTPKLTHKPATEKRGNLVAVYCVVRFANQDPIFKVMTIEELKQIQDLSKAGNRSVWFSKTDPQNWMLKKTCFKQLCKLLPKHLNMTKAVAYDNIVEGGGVMRLDDDSRPIVVEKEIKTIKSKLEEEISKDLEKKENSNIPGFENTLSDLDDISIIPKEEKENFEKMKANLKSAEITMSSNKPNKVEVEFEKEGFDDNTIDDLKENPLGSDDFSSCPPPEELIPALKEEENRIEVKKKYEEEMFSPPVSDDKSVDL